MNSLCCVSARIAHAPITPPITSPGARRAPFEPGEDAPPQRSRVAGAKRPMICCVFGAKKHDRQAAPQPRCTSSQIAVPPPSVKADVRTFQTSGPGDPKAGSRAAGTRRCRCSPAHPTDASMPRRSALGRTKEASTQRAPQQRSVLRSQRDTRLPLGRSPSAVSDAACHAWLIIKYAPWSPPHSTNVHPAPCHSPPSSITTIRFR